MMSALYFDPVIRPILSAALLTLLLAGCAASEPATEPSFKAEQPVVCPEISKLESVDQILQTQQTIAPATADSAPATSLMLGESDLEITRPGVYEISGSTDSGRLVVNSTANGKVTVILNNAEIVSAGHNALEVIAAAELELVLAAGSQNRLISTSNALVPEDENTSVLFSKTDLRISGTGELTIQSAASDGIATRDGLVIDGGKYIIDVKDEGIQAKDFIQIQTGDFSINAVGDGIRTTSSDSPTTGWIDIQAGQFQVSSKRDAVQAETNLTLRNANLLLQAEDDALTTNCYIWLDANTTITAIDDAVHSDNAVALAGGSLTVKAAYEGIEAERLWIYSGTHSISTSNDGINLILKPRVAKTRDKENDYSDDVYLHQFGGEVQVNSAVDGVDVSGNMKILGGTLVSWGTDGGGNNPLDLSGSFLVENGTFAAFSSADRELIKHSKYLPNESKKQSYLVYQTEVKQPAGVLTFSTASGQEFASVAAPQNWLFVYLTSPEIQMNRQYTFTSELLKDIELKPALKAESND